MKKTFRFYSVAVFISTFFFVYFLLHFFVKNINATYKEETRNQTEIILSNVSSRLKNFMDLPLMLGKMGSEHFQNNDMTQENLDDLCEGILKTNRGILGLNLIDKNGKIIAVYPISKNYKALGKKSQHIANLKESDEKKELFWFSQPFELYQRGDGFGLYVPIKKEQQLRGWFTVIMNTQNFIAEFNIDKLMKHYEINIIDTKSNLPLLQTSASISRSKNLRMFNEIVHGRNLNYVIWPKKKFKAPLQQTGIILISLVLALAALLISSLIRFKKETLYKFNEMKVILKLTHREAMEKLIDLQSEFYKLGATENIRYIHQMIEQLDIFQNSIYSQVNMSDENEEIIETLRVELKEHSHFIKKKSLKLNLEILKGQKVFFRTNKWLFRNSVVSNIITHTVLLAVPGTSLSVSVNTVTDKCVLIFRVQQTLIYGFDGEVQDFNKHLEVARKVMHFYGGEITSDEDFAGGLLIRVYIPQTENPTFSYLKWISDKFKQTKIIPS